MFSLIMFTQKEAPLYNKTKKINSSVSILSLVRVSQELPHKKILHMNNLFRKKVVTLTII